MTGDQYFDHREVAQLDALQDEHYWHLSRQQIILDALRAAVSSPDVALLEVGCGAGGVATFLNEHGHHVDYADVHGEAIAASSRRAHKRLGADASERRFFEMDVCEEGLPPGYDGVLLLDVIEHLPDDVGALRRIREGLDDSSHDAVVIVTVPAFPSLWSPHDELAGHKRRYTRRTLRAALEQAGFRVERLSYFFAPLFFAAAGVKSVRKVRNALFGEKKAERLGELVEQRSNRHVNSIMMRVLAPERRLLRKHNVPLGTSLLCVARPA